MLAAIDVMATAHMAKNPVSSSVFQLGEVYRDLQECVYQICKFVEIPEQLYILSELLNYFATFSSSHLLSL